MSKKMMKILSMLLSVSLVMGTFSLPVFAQEANTESIEETVEEEETEAPEAEEAEGLESEETAEQEEEAAAQEEVSEEADEAQTDAEESQADVEEEQTDAAPAEDTSAATVTEEDNEAAGEDSEQAETAEPEAAQPEEGTVEEEAATEAVTTPETAAGDTAAAAVTKEMASVSIGGISYYYTDIEGDAENTVYQAVVKSKAGVTTYDFAFSDLTQVGGTTYYYTVLDGVTPLSGTLYGYGEGTATNYRNVYSDLGVSTGSDGAYDAVTSATGFTGHHAKDIPSLVTFGTSGGEKAITGLTLGRSSTTVDALTVVEASILNAAGETLTADQTEALGVVLKANPMTSPSEDEISVGLSSASFVSSRYGKGEFAIVPDDSASGYVWSEYWNSIYGASISNGETTVGAVHWIDLYGEATTNTGSRHYNKVEIAINNGTSVGSNEAEVSRYAAFFDENTGSVKPGTYTITIYAEGYSNLTAEVEVKSEKMTALTIGGVQYFYADTTDDDAMTVYQAVISGRGGSKTYNYMKSDLTQIGETNMYYTAAFGATPLSGDLYGYGSLTDTNYKEVYSGLGVDTGSDSAYDAVTSATGFTGHHAKDIPSLVKFGSSDGAKAITGLRLQGSATTVDAVAYVEATILKTAGCDMTEEQTAAADIILKANPTVAPSEDEISVALKSASYASSRYGKGEFAIVPDDTVTGYVWSEYWNRLYAATISNGETTVGAVHWIDLYGEAATNTASPHYNKVEIALNNGTSLGTNEAEVSRYAAFFDANTGNIKPGTYTITLYAEGYSDLTATVEIKAEAMSSVTVGGVQYFYADTTDDDATTVYQASVRSRAGTTTYNYTKSDLTQVTGTDLYYTAAFGATPLTGTLYGYEAGSGTATNYKEVYGNLGVSTDTDSAYDAVTSATGFTGHHAKDIPSLVTYGTAGGEKAITGLTLGRGAATVDALTVVEASILQAEGKDLTADQTAALAVTLKASPMTAPSEQEISVALKSASFASCRYGKAEFAIVPDDSVDGYVWSDYWNSMYAATISNGDTTAGAVHWIDLYGEAATNTASPHYNKVEIAINNGTSTGSNEAEVSRYAAFFEGDYIKAGTYTISLYAEGYSTLTAEIEVGVELKDKTADYTGSAVEIDEAVLTGITGDAVYTYYSDEACTKALDSAPVDSGTYYVKAVAASVASNTAKLTIKNPTTITLQDKTATYNGKAIDIAAAKVIGSTGEVTYTYYTDSACTKEASDHKNAGTYYVKATVAGDENYSAATSDAVKLVINKAAQSFTVKASASTVNVGSTVKVTASGAKETTKYTFTSSNSKVATVNASGTVTGKAAGTVTITVKTAATANYNAGTKTVKITVNKVLKKPGNCHFVKWNNAKFTGCRIAWNKVAGADGYQTLLSWTNGSHASTTIVKSNVLYRNCTVAANHVSQMKVRAFYTVNGQRKYGPWSNVEYITPSPAKLTAKNASKGSNLKMNVSWNIIYGCNGYNVFITTNPNGKWYWNQSTSQKATATSAVINKCGGSKLKKNTKYYVRIVTRRKRNGVFCTVPTPAANSYTGTFIIK